MSSTVKISLCVLLGLSACDAVTHGDQAAAPGPRAGTLDSLQGVQPGALGSDDMCAVVMRDSFNAFSTIVWVKSSHKDGKYYFSVSDLYMGTREAKFASRDSPLNAKGVPHDTLNEIREEYEDEVEAFDDDGVVQVDDQLTYVILPESECSKDEFAMIHFFIFEWFYYG